MRVYVRRMGGLKRMVKSGIVKLICATVLGVIPLEQLDADGHSHLETKSSPATGFHTSIPRAFWANNIRAYLNNNGAVFDATPLGGEGLFWPGETIKSLVNSSGLWVSGKDEQGVLRTAVNAYFSFYQAGRLNGVFADTNFAIADTANDPRFSVVMVWDTSTALDPEYQRWVNEAAVTGAPLTRQGRPLCRGKLNAFWLMNDLDTTWMRSQLSHDPRPMGLEISNYVFCFDDGGTLSNVVFLIMDIKNRSIHTYDSTYLGWWSDIDVGDAMSNYAGCDSLLSLGYMYSARDSDSYYGRTPPACGFVFLETPTTRVVGRAMTSFMKGEPQSGSDWQFPADWATTTNHPNDGQYAFLLRGRFIDGRLVTPPGEPEKHITYAYPGDPSTGTGWIGSDDGYPFDYRELQGSGPFMLAAGDSVRFALAFIVAQDTNRLTSVRKLREIVPEVVTRWNSLVDAREAKIDGGVPSMSWLGQNYPNPFNAGTVIGYRVQPARHIESSEAGGGTGVGVVRLAVYDLLGREVAVLVNEKKEPGNYEVKFDGSSLASGVYFYRMQTRDFVQTRKLLLLR
jgi:hypothetical protein